jgi:hypothetical protein
MTELRKAAQDMLASVDYMLQNGEWYQAQKRADVLRLALAQPEEQEDKDAEIERLRKALYYEENRFQRIGTHAPDCWKWGPQHYECALRKIKREEESND